jgi:Zn-finger nucleic acid-binding protein
MTRLETRYPCPVCLAVKMEKVRMPTGTAPRAVVAGRPSREPAGRRSELVLDHCPRCGGAWFDAGEVQLLRGVDAAVLWRQIAQREDPHAMACHACRALLQRTETSCAACGWKVELDCPICAQPMRTEVQSGMRLDYCPRDKGVWFDHDELAGIWKLEAGELVRRRRSGHLDVGEVVLLDALLLDPFVMYYGISAAAHAGGAAIEAVASAGALEGAGEVAGAVGEVASSIFETVAEIIGGIFG